MLTLEQIRQAHARLPRETVTVPDWGGEVVVRGMTGRERDDWEQQMAEARARKERAKDVRARVLVKLIEEAEGKPLFAEADAGWLSGGSARPLSQLWDVAARLSGLTEEERQAAEKNSEAAPSGASGST